MNVLFQFPKAAAYNRVIPKSKIYRYGIPSSRVKELFVKQIEKIIWSYKLSPETINLSAGEGVQEIQVISLILRTGELHHDILLAIDKAIPSPILFEMKYKGKIRYASSFKRASEADKKKWIVSSYFQSMWVNEDLDRTALPFVLHMGALYRYFLTTLSSLKIGETEPLDHFVNRADRHSIKEREAHRIENLMHKEKQFNRKVAMNRKLKELKRDMHNLS